VSAVTQEEFLRAGSGAGTAASMKNTFFVFLAATACAASALAQTSPAPSTSASLTKDERERAISYLKETEKAFLTAIDGVSDAQWKFKAAPDRWSIAETAEHIATSEDFIWARVNDIMKAPANPERRAETKDKDKIILDKIPDRSRKAQAPEPLKPTGKFATREELVKHFKEVRAKEIAFLETTKEDLRSHIADNPALDAMDAYQWVIFNGAHSKRHTAQIQEVKTDANYPKS
jgi:DinB superfamily